MTSVLSWLQRKYLGRRRHLSQSHQSSPSESPFSHSYTPIRQPMTSCSGRRRTPSTAENSVIPDSSTSENSLTDTRTEQHQQKTFMCRLKGGYVNMMLLGYSSVALFCLRSVHCVDLTDGSDKTYLFVQASVECYQWWQQVMVVAILTCVAPFPITLYIGCRMLRSGYISPNQFLVVLTFPPATALVYVVWLVGGTRLVATEDDDRNQRKQEREHILSVLNEPFRRRKSKNKSDGNYPRALIWEPVLIGRRFVLVVVTTFILSPILRLYPVGVMLLLFAVHDHLTKPYNSRDLNLLQFFSTLVLLLLLQVNTFFFQICKNIFSRTQKTRRTPNITLFHS